MTSFRNNYIKTLTRLLIFTIFPLLSALVFRTSYVSSQITYLRIYLFSELGNLPTQHLMDEVKRLQNIAYQLGLEETKEMTRGKYLNILRKRR